MKLNEKGFTVVELILSFSLVMFIALSMFTVITNYKNKEQAEVIKRDLQTLKNTLTQDIYDDTITRKVNYIRYCTDSTGAIIDRCINIKFMDGVEKQLKVVNHKKEVTEDGTKFTYESFYILYGGVKYENPHPKFARVVNDYMFTYTTNSDNIEYGVIYRIKIRISHQDIDDEFVIDVVTTGLAT